MYNTTSLQSTSNSTATAPSPVVVVLYLILAIASVVAFWKIFTKAGEAGWKALIPFYNLYILLKISGMSGWWLLGTIIPLVNIVALILLSMNLAKSFGRSSVFGVIALFFFSTVGYLILGFGKSQYIGPGGNTAAAPLPAQTPAG